MSSTKRIRRTMGVAAAGALLTTGLAAVPATAAPSDNACERRANNTYQKLLECVRVGGVVEHLQAFQEIADANGGNRADQTPGYQASVDYVVDVLEDAGWSAEVVPFTYDAADVVLQRTAPTSDTFTAIDALGSGEGDLTAAVLAVDVNLTGDRANSSGCEPEDFDAFTEGSIALVQRGTCPFTQKVANAEAAGAVGVIVFNQGDTPAPDRSGLIRPDLSGDPASVPVVGVTFATGEELATTASTVRLEVDYYEATSYNVIGELAGRTSGNVVMAGAHLDSVPEGPGINDNASGSAALLEIAQQMGNSRPHSTLRFAWWGAEESGLIGSTAWVEQQTAAELDDIALYLNFDMIGSPNYYFGIYDADESTFPAPVVVPEGSEHIERTFESFYTLRGEPYDDSAYSGRSDYQAFIENGIPSGGLFTGAEEVKTPLQQSIWGGVAGESFDQCYHQACDTIDNVDLHALEVNSDAIAFAVLTYAHSTEAVNGVRGVRVPGSASFRIPAPAGPEGTFATSAASGGHDHDHAAMAR